MCTSVGTDAGGRMELRVDVDERDSQQSDTDAAQE